MKRLNPSFDVAIIGGGSAGYAAAQAAASTGARVAVIEGAREVGGLCILRGCMPSKILLESSHRWHEIKRAGEFGLEVLPRRIHPRQVMARKRRLVSGFADYRRGQLEHGKFTFYRAQARFENGQTLALEGHGAPPRLTARSFVIATGSEISRVPVPGLYDGPFLTSDSALTLETLPKSMIVLGGGAIAVELGQYFAEFGTRLTILQRSAHLVKENDDDVCEELEACLRKSGIRIETNTALERVSHGAKGGSVTYRQGGKRHTVRAERILYSLGRQANVGGLNLEGAGVRTEKGVAVDHAMRSSAPHIFAAGDVTGLHEIVHIAIQQGEAAGWNAAQVAANPGFPKARLRKLDYRLKAMVVFTSPEIGTVGMSEKEAREAGIDCIPAKYTFEDHGKSNVMGREDGFVKLIAEPKRGEIIGGQVIGPHGSDLIHEIIAVMNYRGTAAELAAMPHYHPTLSEIWTYPAEEIAGKVGGKKGR